MSPDHSVAIVFPVYDGVTQLDFTGPHQVLARLPGAQLRVASIDGLPVTADDGLCFAGLSRLQDLEQCDILCVPGGMRCTEAMQSASYMASIRRLGATARYVTSVCSGSMILAAAGLATGRRAASHWFWRDLLSVFGAIPDAGRVVRDGNLITGGGVTAGIDFALTLVAEIAGDDRAQAIQLALEYAPAPPFDAGSPDTAPASISQAVMAAGIASRPDRLALMERIAQAAP